MSVPVQELIHKYEVGAGSRVLKFGLGFLVVLGLAVLYNLFSFRNLTTAEGMDAAQLARNIAEGKGYTTEFIRPLSIYLLKRHALEAQGEGEGRTGLKPVPQQELTGSKPVPQEEPTGSKPVPQGWQWLEQHPDLANAPVYPGLLAAVLKIMPFGYPDLLAAKSFSVYLPDLWIAGFNQLLLLIAAYMVFRVARKLFDEPVAWVSAAVFVGTELFWRLSLAGLPTLLLIVFFLGLAEVLVTLDRAVRDTEKPPTDRRLILLAVAAGVLVGLAGLTRYAFAWLSIPLMLWLVFLPSPKRALVTLAAVVSFLAVMTPWGVRNYNLTGTPFGTATYAAVQNTTQYPEDQLERSLNPDVRHINPGEYWQKFWTHSRDMVQNELPRFGGNWVSALFLAGLLMPFRNPTISRMRIFLLLCLGVLFLAQAMGRTWISTESPDINSENLLVVVAPLAFIFGASLLFTLLESAMPAMRPVILGIFFILACLPLLLSFLLSPSMTAFPPWFQEKAARLNETALTMTDTPWALAWYGHRPGVWLTLKHRAGAEEKRKEDFYAIHEQLKPISALYLTSKTLKTMDMRAVAKWPQEESQDQDWERFVGLAGTLAERFKNAKSEEDIAKFRALLRLVEKHWVRGDEESWASFLLGIYINREVPTGFPLRRAPLGLMPEIFLTDSERKSEKGIQSTK